MVKITALNYKLAGTSFDQIQLNILCVYRKYACDQMSIIHVGRMRMTFWQFIQKRLLL